MHQVFGTQSYSTNFKREKVALGNTQPRYNSFVQGVREKFYINSTRNSEEIPQWMGRTQKHYFRNNLRNRSMHNSNQSNFMNVRQTYIYENIPKVQNNSGPFHCVPRKKIRSHWQMKNHTYELEWPKPEQKKQKKAASQTKSFFLNPETPISKTTKDFVFHLPKYGIKQSPLHVQKSTPLKIGHSTTVDSIFIK